jgi:hypothetical protein
MRTASFRQVVFAIDESVFDCVDAFIDYLSELSFEQWLAVGAQPCVASDTAAILEATIADRQLQIDAWLACDAVETLVFLASSSLPARARLPGSLMTFARAAAERAALAILAGEWLAHSDIAALLSPFRGRSSVSPRLTRAL